MVIALFPRPHLNGQGKLKRKDTFRKAHHPRYHLFRNILHTHSHICSLQYTVSTYLGILFSISVNSTLIVIALILCYTNTFDSHVSRIITGGSFVDCR